jgi:hypothetical protein
VSVNTVPSVAVRVDVASTMVIPVVPVPIIPGHLESFVAPWAAVISIETVAVHNLVVSLHVESASIAA